MSEEAEHIEEPSTQTWSVAVTGGLAALAVAAVATIPLVLLWLPGLPWKVRALGKLLIWMALLFPMAWSIACASGIAARMRSGHRGHNAGLLLCLLETVALGVMLFGVTGGFDLPLAALRVFLFAIPLVIVGLTGGVLAGSWGRGTRRIYRAMLIIWLLPGLTVIPFKYFDTSGVTLYAVMFALKAPFGPWAPLIFGGTFPALFGLASALVITFLLLGTACFALGSRSNDAGAFWLCLYTGAVATWSYCAFG